MNFGEALSLLKQGKKVCRENWNGKGMWLIIFKPQCLVAVTENGEVHEKEYTMATDVVLPIQPAIYMKTVDDKFIPWLASQTDVLSEDWQLVK